MMSIHEHLRDITLDHTGQTVRFVFESDSAELPKAADRFCRDVAASLAMYIGKLDPFPGRIRVELGTAVSAEGRNGEAETDVGAAELMEKVVPRFSLDDFICPPAFRRVLDDVVFYARRYPEIRARVGVESVTRGFLVNFFGASGTGKTMAAEAFARELGKDLYVMNFANVESSLLGRTPKNIARAFRAVSPESAIIMLDEADGFVSRRIVDLRQGAEYALNTARGRIIAEIDRFGGTIILATNLFGTYDSAILRRIKFNLPFELPSEGAIAKMLQRYLGSVPDLQIEFEPLARLAAGLSGGDVYNLAEIIVMKSLQRSETGEPPLTLPEIEEIVAYYRSKAPAGTVHERV
ncbi:MAG TPA: ATP-binding protein [Anaerolineales bacterium]|nr:ATP-binding protein [Anaerolineales bacterium]